MASPVPYIVLWRNGVMDDPHPALTWRALVAAMALTRFANSESRSCYPGSIRCAKTMRVSPKTIERGWSELREAGWLKTTSRGEGNPTLKTLTTP